MKKILGILAVIVTFVTEPVLANCFLTIEKAGSQNKEMLENQAQAYLSQFVEKVEPIPFGGIDSDACLYKVNLMENREGFFITISGQKIQSDGFSSLTGFGGAKQALLRAIYKVKPKQQKEICEIHSEIIPKECGLEVANDKTGPDAKKPTKVEQKPFIEPNQSRQKTGPCRDEIRRYCDLPMGPELQKCLRENFRSFSKTCRTAIRKTQEENRSRRRTIIKAARVFCKNDIKAYCQKEKKDINALSNCLRKNRSNLSKECRQGFKTLRESFQ